MCVCFCVYVCICVLVLSFVVVCLSVCFHNIWVYHSLNDLL